MKSCRSHQYQLRGASAAKSDFNSTTPYFSVAAAGVGGNRDRSGRSLDRRQLPTASIWIGVDKICSGGKTKLSTKHGRVFLHWRVLRAPFSTRFACGVVLTELSRTDRRNLRCQRRRAMPLVCNRQLFPTLDPNKSSSPSNRRARPSCRLRSAKIRCARWRSALCGCASNLAS